MDNRVVLRIGGALLVLLALSPFTAPFLTCDILDFTGDPVPHDRPLMYSKSAQDEPAAALMHLGQFVNPRAAVEPAAALPAEPVQQVERFRLPLRL